MNPLNLATNIVRTTAGLGVDVIDRVVIGGGDEAASSSSSSSQKKRQNKTGEHTLCDETDVMLNASALVYVIVELRKIARAKLDDLKLRNGLSSSYSSDDKGGKESVPLTDEDVRLLDGERTRSEKLGKRILDLAATSSSSQEEEKREGSLKADYAKSQKALKKMMKDLDLTESDVDVLGNQFDLLAVPKTTRDIKSDIVINADTGHMKAFLLTFGYFDPNFNLNALLSLIDRESNVRPSVIHRIDDEFERSHFDTKSELCYSIAINDEFKSIAIVFRGSVNLNDWMTNLNWDMTKLRIDHPTCGETHSDYGRIHQGFYQYLFGNTREGADKETISKADNIVEDLLELFEEFPKSKDYTLYCTGHSLGGALCTIMGFRLSLLLSTALKDSPAPIRIISFASPYVGDQEFRNAFQQQERKGALVHLRVTNNEDMVTLMPFATFSLFDGLINTCKHVGMQLKLYPNTVPFLRSHTHRFVYPKPGDWTGEIGRAIQNNALLGISLKVLPNHLCPEYDSRLERSKDALSQSDLTLSDLYANRELVGSLFDDDTEE